jgi:hypothetical protein
VALLFVAILIGVIARVTIAHGPRVRKLGRPSRVAAPGEHRPGMAGVGRSGAYVHCTGPGAADRRPVAQTRPPSVSSRGW